MTERDTITIMADYGMAPYAWLRRAGRTEGVGGNIADSSGGFPEEYGVSKQLEQELAEWAINFECNTHPWSNSEGFGDFDFDWKTFHEKGLQLSKQLKDEIGHQFNIVYEKPMEDPNYEVDETTIL